MKHSPEPGSRPPDVELAMVPAEEYFSGKGQTHNTAVERHSSSSPGGRIAKDRGCTCPVIHDARGNTVLLVDGHRMMVYRKDCPVHAPVKFDHDAFITENARLRREGKKGLYFWNAKEGKPVAIKTAEEFEAYEKAERDRKAKEEKDKEDQGKGKP